MPSFNVPQELIETIIDEVANDTDEAQRLSTLTACSRTSWSFLTPCRRYLFEEVVLVENAGDDTEEDLKDQSRLQKFLEILENDPCLLSEHQRLSMHIKSLYIVLSRVRGHSRLGAKQNFSKREDASLLPSILKLIPQVRQLKLSSTLNHASTSWILVDDSLKKALTQFCATQPIDSMKLRDIDGLPLSLIANCLGLVSLSVYGLTNVEEPMLCPLSRSSFAKLESLSATFCPDFLRVLHHVSLGTSSILKYAYSSLRRLETSLGRTEWEFISSLSSLSYLCISRTSETFNHYYYLDLRRLPMLHHLKLKWDFGTTIGMMTLLPVIAWPKPGSEPEVEDISVPQTTPISTLEIFGKWNFCTRRNEQQHLMASAGWNSLDAVLSGAMFCNLRYIRLDLTLYYTDLPPSPKSVEKYLLNKVQTKLHELLPVLCKSNLVQIQLDIHVPDYYY